jgi:hypothetical protein
VSFAKPQSARGSNAIEGIVTSDDRFVKPVRQNVSPPNHAEKEIAGHSMALNEARANF